MRNIHLHIIVQKEDAKGTSFIYEESFNLLKVDIDRDCCTTIVSYIQPDYILSAPGNCCTFPSISIDVVAIIEAKTMIHRIDPLNLFKNMIFHIVLDTISIQEYVMLICFLTVVTIFSNFCFPLIKFSSCPYLFQIMHGFRGCSSPS